MCKKADEILSVCIGSVVMFLFYYVGLCIFLEAVDDLKWAFWSLAMLLLFFHVN